MSLTGDSQDHTVVQTRPMLYFEHQQLFAYPCFLFAFPHPSTLNSLLHAVMENIDLTLWYKLSFFQATRYFETNGTFLSFAHSKFY